MARRLSALLLGLVLVEPGASEAAVRPRFGGRAVRGHLGTISRLDPLAATSAAEREAARQLHAGLYRLDAEGEPVPDLVESAEVEAGGGAVRLVLRPAWFHDGRPVRAEDVRESLERFVRAPGAGQLLARPSSAPSAVVLGERTLRLRVDAAARLWRWLLADLGAAVVPASDGGSSGAVGAGPFVLLGREPGGILRLGAYVRHHRGRPLLDALEYRSFPDEQSLLLAHRYQDIDLVDRVGLVGAAPPAAGWSVGSASETVALRVNRSRPPGDRLGLRQRVVAALRLEPLIEVVLGGQVTPVTGILSLHPSLPVLGPDRGKGTETGNEREGRGAAALRLVHAGGAGLQSVAERMRVDLHAVGLAVTLDELDDADLAATLGSGRFDLALIVLAGDTPSEVALAEAAAALDRPLPAALVAAAADAAGGAANELLAAEAEVLAGAELKPLFRRERSFLGRESLRDVRVGRDGLLVLEDAWRWR